MEPKWLLEAAASSLGVTPSQPQLDAEVSVAAARLAERRAAGEPLQYVTGIAGFRELTLKVGPGVLIPRPETELLCERAMAHLARGGRVVDIGTGSGAIALAIAHERADARVWGTDDSAIALSWARLNAGRLGLDVTFVETDLFADLPRVLRGELDLVVSNPPYVAPGERALLPVEVAEHEPPEALFAGVTGLEVIARLVEEACAWLRPQGWLFFEIGETQGLAASDLLDGHGYVEIAIEPDLVGRDRIARGRRP